jgi:hypothetical protein
LKERLEIVENIYFTECIRTIVVRSETMSTCYHKN